MKWAITEPMRRALDALAERREQRGPERAWEDAYTLQCSMQTLDALVKRGLAERRGEGALGAMFSPRTTIEYRLRLPE